MNVVMSRSKKNKYLNAMTGRVTSFKSLSDQIQKHVCNIPERFDASKVHPYMTTEKKGKSGTINSLGVLERVEGRGFWNFRSPFSFSKQKK